MASKITHAQARREADTYRSQGLPQEALRVYQDLLESAPPLPVNTQAAIRDQIQRIKIQCDSVDECATLKNHVNLLVYQCVTRNIFCFFLFLRTSVGPLGSGSTFLLHNMRQRRRPLSGCVGSLTTEKREATR